MHVARTISALLIALSVAILPATLVPNVGHTTEMAAVAEDCCPPTTDPCSRTMHDCTLMAACVLKCFGFSAASTSVIAFSPIVASLVTGFETGSFHAQTGNTPFRPPRT